MLSGLSIWKKLNLAILASLVSLAVLALTSSHVISKLGGSLDAAVNQTGKKLELLGNTREAFGELKHQSLRAQVAYAILELERNAKDTSKQNCSSCHQPASLSDGAREIEAAEARVKHCNSELRRLVSDEAARKALDCFDEGASKWVTHTKEYLRLADGKRFEEAHTVLAERLFPILPEVEKAAGTLAKIEEEALTASNRNAHSLIAGGRWTLFLVIGFNLLVGTAVPWLVSRICLTMRQVASGLSTGAEQVAAAASEVSASSHSLAQGSAEQAASLQQTSASSEQINSMARKNAANSRQAATLVSDFERQFSEAGAALKDLQAAMSGINASSAKISKIIKVIDEVAFQTNILALNAAVEAARAGEAGLGFAVVADEVRGLAGRCAKAATETAVLIEESQANSHEGKSKVDRVAAVIRNIAEQSGKIMQLVEEVNAGSQDQTRGIEQVANALSQMETVTQKTAASAQESAAASEELSAQSATLRDLVEQLRSTVDGSRSASQTHPAPVLYSNWKE